MIISKRIKRKHPRENREGENLSWNRKERNRKGKHTYRRTEKDDVQRTEKGDVQRTEKDDVQRTENMGTCVNRIERKEDDVYHPLTTFKRCFDEIKKKRTECEKTHIKIYWVLFHS